MTNGSSNNPAISRVRSVPSTAKNNLKVRENSKAAARFQATKENRPNGLSRNPPQQEGRSKFNPTGHSQKKIAGRSQRTILIVVERVILRKGIPSSNGAKATNKII